MLRAEALTTEDLFQLIWRQRYALMGFALTGAAIAYGYALFVPDLYTAETLVLVEDAEVSSDYIQSTSTLSLRARLDTLREHVLSRTRLESLVDEYQLADRDATREEAVAKVRRRISIDVIGQDGFRLAFTDEDPRMAARAANALAGFFITESIDSRARQVRSTAAGMQQQSEDLLLQLDAKEEEIATFKAANLLMLPDQFSGNLDMLQTLRQQLRDNDSRVSAVRGQLATLPMEVERGVADGKTGSARDIANQVLATALTADAIASRLRGEHPLVRLEVRRTQREALLRRFTERHPDVRLLTAEVEDLTRQVASAEPYQAAAVSSDGVMIARPGSARASLEWQVTQFEAERRALLADLSEYQRRADGSAAVERRLRNLERERDSLERNYTEVSGRTVEAELASDLQNANSPFNSYRVIDPAIVPSKPSAPTRLFFLLGGALAGMALVGGAAFLRETIFEPVNSASEIERFTDLDVLASIPIVQTAKLLRRQRLIRTGSFAAVGSMLVIVFVLRMMMRGS